MLDVHRRNIRGFHAWKGNLLEGVAIQTAVFVNHLNRVS